MKEKLHKEVFRIGSKHVNVNDLRPYEAVSMSLVAVLSIALGTIYGTMLF